MLLPLIFLFVRFCSSLGGFWFSGLPFAFGRSSDPGVFPSARLKGPLSTPDVVFMYYKCPPFAPSNQLRRAAQSRTLHLFRVINRTRPLYIEVTHPFFCKAQNP